MLADFLLELVTNPEKLVQFKQNRDKFLAEKGLSKMEVEAVKQGDLHSLRGLLYREAAEATGTKPYLASDYTVSTSCDTPHCPINISGLFHPSFWGVMEPDYLWDVRGLTIVGTGIRAGLQTSPESLICIRNADKVLFLVADLLSHLWIKKLNQTAESMQNLYKKGKYRLEIYNDIVQKILSTLRKAESLCVVFYGHPGTFVYPAHEAIRLARKEGFRARMLPGISAENNLFADLGVDPGVAGMQSYEATNFVLNRYRFDTSAGLILWQIGLFGNAYWDPKYKASSKKLRVLVDYLKEFYGSDHEVVIYEASEFPLGNAKFQRLPLSGLPRAKISGVATLYVPPRVLPSADLDMAKKLDIPLDK